MTNTVLATRNFHLSVLVATVLLLAVAASEEQRGSQDKKKFDYCIIGAGPAGLQMAYYLKKAGRDYRVFEKSNMTGYFFGTYPKHRKLISINKLHTGQQNPEYNLRHDWNSLLSDDPSLLFKHFSRDYFPHADAMVKYLDEYRRKLGLDVQFDSEARKIRRLPRETPTGHRFQFEDQRGDTYSCKYMLMANGMSKPNEPYFEGHEMTVGYEEVSTDVADFEAKTVLILGRGNSAFETANHVAGVANYVHLLASSPPRFAWSTHYVGDLRAVNNELLDHYQLKSLDGLLEANLNILRLVRTKSGKMALQLRNDSAFNYAPPEDEYDVVVRCLGFAYNDDMFSPCTKPERAAGRKAKFPLANRDFESANVPDLYFIGSAAHSLDFRETAGGFVHGFRYTSRALHRLLEWKNHGVPWPSERRPLAQLTDAILTRVNEASGIYQMHHFLGDVVIIDRSKLEFEYLQEFPLPLLAQFEEKTGRKVEGKEVIVVALRYNPDFSGPRLDTFHSQRSTDDVEKAHLSNFLHPVIYYYNRLAQTPAGERVEELENRHGNPSVPVPDRIHHVLEDFLTRWTSPHLHVEPLRRFLESCLGVDLRRYRSTECFAKLLDGAAPDVTSPLPLSCVQRPEFEAGSHFLHSEHGDTFARN
ncbi:FAD-dependent oxidoreductase domain-containing protein 2-like [Dermacentor albipictus]|uniref:FAD-dependent oxidoreductase domain-containing protein 2-like n=1 Tax=Dermacentor albipictus TaxID=60249 RepID=UPI0031FD2480